MNNTPTADSFTQERLAALHNLTKGPDSSASTDILESLLVARDPIGKDIGNEHLRSGEDSAIVLTTLSLIPTQKLKFCPELINTFTQPHHSTEIRCAALKALGFVAAKHEFNTYLQLLQSETDEHIIAACIAAFSWAPRSAHQLLMRTLENGKVTALSHVARAAKEISYAVQDLETRELLRTEEEDVAALLGEINSAEYKPRNNSNGRDDVDVYGSYFWYRPGDNDRTDMVTRSTNPNQNTWEYAIRITTHSGTNYKGEVFHRSYPNITSTVDVRHTDGRYHDWYYPIRF